MSSLTLAAGLLDVWDFRSRFAPLQNWEVPPPLEALQAAAASPDGQPAVMLELLRPLLLDVRKPNSSCAISYFNVLRSKC